MNLEDLESKSISEMSKDEAIELLRQIRLSRRTRPKPKSKSKSKPKTQKISPQMARALLDILGG